MISLSPLMEEILSAGGTVELTVTGYSMRPMLLHKESRVRLAPARNLRKGDIPMYCRDNGAFVLHRIVALEDDAYTCCGDNQWQIEAGIRQDQIVAVVTHFCRNKRWVDCGNIVYSTYWHFWVAIRPLRRLIFGGWRRIKRIVRRCLK